MTTVARGARRHAVLIAWLALTAPVAGLAQVGDVEEVIVTATRRAENLQDLPASIRALDGEALEKSGAERFEDYILSVPGTDIVDTGFDKRIAIRGISNLTSQGTGVGASTSPVGLYLNDTPIQGNGVLPDLDLYDLERIEVLKGPQGSLYGEGAQGGAIRMLLRKADPLEASIKADFGVGGTVNASGLDDSQKLAVNVPIIEGKWAVRLVGSRRWNPGYVDYFNLDDDGEGDGGAENLAGRLHLDGEIWPGFDVSALMMRQEQRIDQFPYVQLAEGDLRNRHTEPQFADTDFTLGALTLDYDLGFAVLTSSTSVMVNDRDALARVPFIGSVVFGLIGDSELVSVDDFPEVVEEEWYATKNHQVGIAQELRLVSAGDEWLDWVAGFFYRQRDNDFDWLIDDSLFTGVPPPVGPGVSHAIGVESFEQYALFGEATLDLPWNLEPGFGLRVFREDFALDATGWVRGPLFPFAVVAENPADGSTRKRFEITTTAVAPKAWLSWYADDSRMLYAQVAKGVKSGGGNIGAVLSTLPGTFDPDTLWSYEVGAKTQWLDGRLTANVAAFYNDWKDLQIRSAQQAMIGGVVPASQGLIVNAGHANAYGGEVDLVALPLEDVTLGFSAFVAEGEIVEGDGEVVADHSPLPQLADFSYSANAQYAPARWAFFDLVPFAQFSTQFTGERLSFPQVLGIDSPLDEIQTYDAGIGVTGSWIDVTFSVKNLTDTRSQIGSNPLDSESITIGRPRTWMARVGVQF